MLGAETLDLIQLDVGVLRLGHGGTRDPPVGAGQPRGQKGSRSGRWMRPVVTGMRDNFAMCGLPKPDKARLLAEHDGVVPSPDHRFSAVRRARDRYEMTG
jgi:hypothetical protein